MREHLVKLSRPLAVLAVFAMLALSPAVALAQDPPAVPSCGEALRLLGDANRAHQEAVSADNALADAQAALDALPPTATDQEREAAQAAVDSVKPAADATDAAELKAKLDEAAEAATEACRGEPGTPAPTTAPSTAPPPATAPPAGDKDCDDFITRDEAQAYFASRGYSAGNDPERLDENDNDGLACEHLPPASGGPEPKPSGQFGQVGAANVPRGPVDTGGA